MTAPVAEYPVHAAYKNNSNAYNADIRFDCDIIIVIKYLMPQSVTNRAMAMPYIQVTILFNKSLLLFAELFS